MGMRFSKKMQATKWCYTLVPAILALNMLKLLLVKFRVMGMQGTMNEMFYMGGPWNAMNAVAGVLSALTICGWFGVVISKDKHHSFVWPDMMWFWIIAYDLWNFAYVGA